MAGAAVLLAGKVEERARKLRNVALQFMQALQQRQPGAAEAHSEVRFGRVWVVDGGRAFLCRLTYYAYIHIYVYIHIHIYGNQSMHPPPGLRRPPGGHAAAAGGGGAGAAER